MSQFGDYESESFPAYLEGLDEQLARLRNSFVSEREKIAAICESPIELKLAEAMQIYSLQIPCIWRLENASKVFGGLSMRTEIAPQLKINSLVFEKTYRVDFAIMHRHRYGMCSRLIVECDGHNFHERTKEQAARDRQKDRDIQSVGWKILRFTGSEIYADADLCADQIFTQIYNDSAADFQKAEMEGRT